jgi:hypothetical protein
MSIEAMKQALEALEKNYALINGDETRMGLEGCIDSYYRGCFDVAGINRKTDVAITALRTAIAEAEKQGPVAFNRKAVWNVLFEVWNQNISASEGLQKLQDLYTNPPAAQQEPVSPAQKDAVFAASIEFIETLTGMTPPPIEIAPPEVFKTFRDFTEKVCSIFATPPAAQQEPVAWMTKELMADYLDMVAEAIADNKSETLRHKAYWMRKGDV